MSDVSFWLTLAEIVVMVAVVWVVIVFVLKWLEDAPPKAATKELTQEEVNNYRGVCAGCSKGIFASDYWEDELLRRYHVGCEKAPVPEFVWNVLCVYCGNRVGHCIQEPIVRVEGHPLHEGCVERFKNVVPIKGEK